MLELKEEANKMELKENQSYTKEQLLKSKQFGGYLDLLVAILADGKEYTKQDVIKKVEDFLKRSI